MKRNKNKFEQFFSLKRHIRRLGGRKLSEDLSNEDLKKIKKTILPDEEIVYTHGSSDKLLDHISSLQKEFSGQSELLFYHAKIIVLIRRGIDTNKNIKIFENLWLKEKKFLVENLNIRWLVSASDTFIDHSSDNCTKALAFSSICLVNTLKLQESERFIGDMGHIKDNKEKINRLDNEERFPLFDGTSVFKFGTDDTIRNMRWRLNKLAKLNVAGEILLEIFLRVQNFDTVYQRTKKRHTREKTSWW